MAGINPLQLPKWETAPQIDWSPLARIGDAIGQYRRDAQLKDAVAGSMDGDTVNNRKLGRHLIDIGRIDEGLKFLTLDQQQQAAREFGGLVGGVFGGSPSPTAPPPGGQPAFPASAPTAPPSVMPQTGVAPARPEVRPSARVWGDREAEGAGLYEPQPRPAQVAQAPAPQPAPPSSLDRAAPAIARAVANPNAPDGMRQVGLAILKEAMERQRLTDSQRNARDPAVMQAEIEKAQRTRPTPEYEASVANAKKVGESYGTQYTDLMKAGRSAAGEIGTLDYMDSLVQRPDFYSGTGAGAVMRVKRALAGIGVAVPDAASATEVFEALSNRLVLDASGGSLGAQISNSDRDFLMNTAPGLSRTPEGNRELIGAARRVAQRKQDVARLAREYAARNGGRIDAGFDQALADWAEKNPIFPQGRPAAAPAAQGETPAAPQPTAAPSVQGARQAPDGYWYVPDPKRPGKYLQVQ